MPVLSDERALVAALKQGDERAFMDLVTRWHRSMVHVAMAYVPSRAVAEEVVQETWLGVLQGIDRFEERSSLKTWVFRILVNRARTRGERERRTTPFSSLGPDEASVDPDRFLPPGHEFAGGWDVFSGKGPRAIPEDRLVERETLEEIRRAIDALPENQRAVISLRDLEGWDAAEVAELLGVTDGNQRVLLHRARSRVRAAVEMLA